MIHMSCGDEFCPEERSKTSMQITQVLFYLLTFNLKERELKGVPLKHLFFSFHAYINFCSHSFPCLDAAF